VDIVEQAVVDRFLPPRQARYKLDPRDPHAFGALTRPDVYMEMRLRQQEAMDQVRRVLPQIEEEWAHLTGRRHGALETYHAEDAEVLLVTSGTITSTARYAVDRLREHGASVGLVKVKLFRPFPSEMLRSVLEKAERVAVVDRNISPGHGGIFAEEIRSALYDLNPGRRPEVYGYVVGLGGRDVTPQTLLEIFERTRTAGRPEREDLWIGVKA
jgi:pyruvate/2-oxoacid:ferredoxin oxidoreductase alpha subunit